MSPIQLPNCTDDCDDYGFHSIAGFCLVSTGLPVVVASILDCNTDSFILRLINPATGLEIPFEPIQQCASSGTGSQTAVALGHENIVVSDSSVSSLTVPAGAQFAWIENYMTSNKNIRYKTDGTSPVTGGNSGSGHWLAPGSTIETPVMDLSLLRFIKDANGGAATIEVSYYKYV